MKCPYPDCQGDVSEGEQFCGECGRSLAPEAVAAAKAGMATNPLTTSVLPPPPPTAQPIPPIMPAPPPVTPAAMPVTAPVARSNNMMPWIVIGLLGFGALSVVCCLGLVYVSSMVQPTPTVPPTENTALTFDLSELTADNSFQVDKDVRAPDGRKLAVVSFKSGYNYEAQGSPELITTIEVLVNNKMALELAATNEAKYAETNPEFEVATAGQTYTRTAEDNLNLDVNVDRVSIVEMPKLANDTDGNQPAFKELALTVAVQAP